MVKPSDRTIKISASTFLYPSKWTGIVLDNGTRNLAIPLTSKGDFDLFDNVCLAPDDIKDLIAFCEEAISGMD
jgi:hypothetical protein